MTSLKSLYKLLIIVHAVQIVVNAGAGIISSFFMIHEGQLTTLYLLGAFLSLFLLSTMYFLEPNALKDSRYVPSTRLRVRLRMVWAASAFFQATWFIVLLLRAGVTTHQDIKQVSAYALVVCFICTFVSWISTLFAIWSIQSLNDNEAKEKVVKIIL
jgi:hypothetical protein